MGGEGVQRLVADQLPRLIFGLSAVALAVGYLLKTQDYRWGTLARPGPAVFPTLLGGALVVLGLILVVEALLKKNLAEGESREGANSRVLFLFIGVLLLYVPIILLLGFTSGSIAVVLVLLHIFSAPLRLWGRLVYSVLVVCIPEITFSWLFDIGFPGGWFNFLR